MHLMELSERSSAILMVHKARKNVLSFWNKALRSGSDHVVVAFEAMERLRRVFIKPMTAISALYDVHEDICMGAKRKRAEIVILPFHKHQRFDGMLEVTSNDFRTVNRKVLEHVPCSVGILVDRGLGGITHISASDLSSSVTVIYFGGRDDREAPVYGSRMAEYPGIRLTVLCFFKNRQGGVGDSVTSVDSTAERRLADLSLLDEFKRRMLNDQALKYVEVVGREETLMGRCNLFLMGRTPENAQNWGL